MYSLGHHRMASRLASVAPRVLGSLSHPNGQSRQFSDKLLGYSPMAPGGPAPEGKRESRMPTAEEVSTMGGVWAPTSAKRDKLAELKIALEEGQFTLDDAARPEQRLDLDLADGLCLVVQTTDGLAVDLEQNKDIQEFADWMVEQQAKLPESFQDETHLVAQMAVLSERITQLLSKYPSSQYLREVRDFFDPKEADEEHMMKLKEEDLQLQDADFEMAVLRFRLLLTQAVIEHVKASWALLTTVSDGDTDRAAVKGETVAPQEISLPKLYKFIFAHVAGTCHDRVDAAWELLDRDEDGMLDESEMNQVAQLCVVPIQSALVTLFEEALEAAPLRAPLPPLGSDTNVPAPALGWRQRRREKKEKKAILKLFKNSCEKHFADEVEIDHRLRCIYAWAEKEHQENKLDSVLIDAGWSGRKRYVELAPKITLPEFRVVQQEHFTHLDRISKEILKSFREDLLVYQGKGRQNWELIRDCSAFLTIVCLADYIILLQ